jgi:glucan endo-1,3-alpha-glucosidase
MTWIDGMLNWDSGWPMGGSNLDTSSDTRYINNLGGKTYMPAVSPCFFTYYGPNSWNKNWLYRSDNWLLATRWEKIISMRSQSDMVEVLTWNGEWLAGEQVVGTAALGGKGF